MKHDKALLAVDLVEMAILQGLINDRVDGIDTNRPEVGTTGVGRDKIIETALLKLRVMLRRVTARQFLA